MTSLVAAAAVHQATSNAEVVASGLAVLVFGLLLLLYLAVRKGGPKK